METQIGGDERDKHITVDSRQQTAEVNIKSSRVPAQLWDS